MACRRKCSTVAPRCGGTAASTVSPVGEAANRSVSAQRRTAEPVGIGPTARLEGKTESTAFRRGRRRGPGRPLSPAKLRYISGVADHSGTDRWLEDWTKGRTCSGAFRRRGKGDPGRPRQTAKPRTEVFRHRGEQLNCEVGAAKWSPKAQLEENARSEVFCTDEQAASESCSVGDARSPRCLDVAALPNPMRWTRGRGAKGTPEPMRFDAAAKANPEAPSRTAHAAPEALRRRRTSARCEARGRRSCPPKKLDSRRFGDEEKADSTGVHTGYARPGVVAPGRVTCRARTAHPRIREPRRLGVAGIG